MQITEYIYLYPERGILDANTYVIRGRKTLLIDAGSVETINDKLREMAGDGIEAEAIDIITTTHLHPDHFWATDALQQISGAEVIIPELQGEYRQRFIDDSAQIFGLQGLEFTPSSLISDGSLDLGGTTLQAIHTPGHSPESYCFYDPESKFLACGDVIFERNVGRTDFPGGSSEKLKASIEGLAALKVDYLLPGHMDVVRGPEQVRDNFTYVRKMIDCVL